MDCINPKIACFHQHKTQVGMSCLALNSGHWCPGNPRPKRGELIGKVFAEISRAETLHPGWPENIYEQLAIIGEEFGELQQAALDNDHKAQNTQHIEDEAVQLAAMALRFLFNLKFNNEKTGV